jgi:hypothetical protein
MYSWCRRQGGVQKNPQNYSSTGEEPWFCCGDITTGFGEPGRMMRKHEVRTGSYQVSKAESDITARKLWDRFLIIWSVICGDVSLGRVSPAQTGCAAIGYGVAVFNAADICVYVHVNACQSQSLCMYLCIVRGPICGLFMDSLALPWKLKSSLPLMQLSGRVPNKGGAWRIASTAGEQDLHRVLARAPRGQNPVPTLRRDGWAMMGLAL